MSILLKPTQGAVHDRKAGTILRRRVHVGAGFKGGTGAEGDLPTVYRCVSTAFRRFHGEDRMSEAPATGGSGKRSSRAEFNKEPHVRGHHLDGGAAPPGPDFSGDSQSLTYRFDDASFLQQKPGKHVLWGQRFSSWDWRMSGLNIKRGGWL